jgi:ferredoxin
VDHHHSASGGVVAHRLDSVAQICERSPMQEPPGADPCRVTIADTGQSFVCEPGFTILDAGLIAGIGLPHTCRNGSCGTCKSQVIEGRVDHGWVRSFAITEQEKAAGKCLICQSKPASDHLVIRPDGALNGS